MGDLGGSPDQAMTDPLPQISGVNGQVVNEGLGLPGGFFHIVEIQNQETDHLLALGVDRYQHRRLPTLKNQAIESLQTLFGNRLNLLVRDVAMGRDAHFGSLQGQATNGWRIFQASQANFNSRVILRGHPRNFASRSFGAFAIRKSAGDWEGTFVGELEAYLERIQGQGTRVSSGFFSLDLAAAQRKLAGFFAAEELDFLHYWVRFAVAEGASAIEVQTGKGGIRLGFLGAVPAREVFLGGVLATDLSPRYLHMGFLGAYRQGADKVRVLHPEFQLDFVDGQPEIKNEGRGEGCWLEALPGKGARHWGHLPALQRALDFPHLAIPLRVNGKGWKKVASAPPFRLRDQEGRHFAAELPDPRLASEGALQPAQLRVLVHGADLAGLASLSFPPGTRVFWDNPHLPLDLSMRKLRQDSLARVECDQLSLQFAAHLEQDLGRGTLRIEQLGLPVCDWLVEQVCRAGDLERAFQLFTQASPLFVGGGLLMAGWKERGAQLAMALEAPQVSALWEESHLLWQGWLQQAAQADPQWHKDDLEPQQPQQRQLSLKYQAAWRELVLAGCLCRTQPEGLIPALANMRGSLTVHLYREWVRQSVHGGRPGKEFLRLLERYRKDSLVRSVLYLQELTALGPNASDKLEAIFAGEIIVAAALGQEAPGDLADLSVLTADHRASLLEVVRGLCLSRLEEPGLRFHQEFSSLLERCQGWFEAQELE